MMHFTFDVRKFHVMEFTSAKRCLKIGIGKLDYNSLCRNKIYKESANNNRTGYNGRFLTSVSV